MAIKIIYLIVFISLFINSLLETNGYDFEKGKTFKTNRDHVVFDPTEFKVDEEIIFKIEATEFNDDKLGYQFLDVLTDNISDSNNSNIKYTDPTKKSTNKKTKIKTRKYTIKKSKEVLGNMEGKYLILYFNCEGTFEVQNIAENGSSTIIIALVVGIAIISFGVFYFLYLRKRFKKNNGGTDEVVYEENCPPNYYNQQPGNFSNNVMINNNQPYGNMNYNHQNMMVNNNFSMNPNFNNNVNPMNNNLNLNNKHNKKKKSNKKKNPNKKKKQNNIMNMNSPTNSNPNYLIKDNGIISENRNINIVDNNLVNDNMNINDNMKIKDNIPPQNYPMPQQNNNVPQSPMDNNQEESSIQSQI